MEKGLLFFTIAAACIWLILDEFYGTKKITAIVNNLTPDLQSPIDAVMNGTLTDNEKQSNIDGYKEDIQNSPNIKTQKAKDSVKEAVDKFFEGTGGQPGKVY